MAVREPSFTVAASAVNALLRRGESLGVAVQPLLDELQLPRDDVDARIPQARYNALFDALAARTHDADFGLHLAEHGDVDGFDVVGHLAARSSSVKEALERVARYSRIVHDGGRVEVEATTGGAVIYPGCRGLLHEFPRQIAEYSAASVVVMIGALTQARVQPRRVEFRHARPPSIAEHERIFGCAPRFGMPETLVELDDEVLQRRTMVHDAGLVGVLERYARELVERLTPDEDLVAQVKREIAVVLMDGRPAVENVAGKLGLGARTLQRRLAEHELTFQDLVEDVRRSCAARYVRDGKLPLQEVSFLLGFSDVSNFHRSFRRWYGMTPAEYRTRVDG